MATAIIKGVVVTGSVYEIAQLIAQANTKVTTAASTNWWWRTEPVKNAKPEELRS